MGRIAAVCISGHSGMPRPQVDEGTLSEGVGFVGNRHSVGGAREVCLFDMETYTALQVEGMTVGPGAFGENLTLEGVPFDRLQSGDRLRVGAEAVLEITIVRKPCSKLAAFDPRLPEALVGRSGWMARVVRGGTVSSGDTVEIERDSQANPNGRA